jgi:serine/threonine protein kinase
MLGFPGDFVFVCVRCKREVTTEGHFCPFCGTVAPQEGDARDPYIGQTVAQKYFVHLLLGGGGMGQVYKATHLTLDRPVALKILKRSLLADSSIVQRFHREARAASRLNHPNSINVIDFGQTEDGTLFLAMEYLAGRNLLKLLSEDFPVEPRRVVKILSQVLAALTEAHALGILHRDLKPENVMVDSRHDETDFVKVLDFGIAKLHEPGDSGGARLTQAGMVCGTPGYMSPEQTRGEELDARSDLYSVGVILYELLTGKLPFDADTPLALAAKALVDTPIPASERRPDLVIPADLEALAMRALSADPNGRPASAEEFRRELLACGVPEAQPAPFVPPLSHETVVLEAKRMTPRPARLSPAPAKRPLSRPPQQVATELKPRSTPAPPLVSGPAKASPTPRPRTPAPERRPTPRPDRLSAEPDADETEIVDGSPLPGDEGRARDRLLATIRSHLPLVVGTAAGLVLLLVLVVVGFRLRPSPPKGPAQPPVAHREEPARPPQESQPQPGPGTAVSQIGTPRGEETPEVRLEPENRPVDRPPRRSPIRSIAQSINAMRVPPSSSGDGILVINATPWAIVAIDGRSIGETPREVRIAEGSYRVRLSHPQLPGTEATVTVTAGKRAIFNATLHK